MARTKQTARRTSSYQPTLRPQSFVPPPKPLTKKQLTSWLKVNRLILQNRTSDQILKDALNDIIQSLGSIKDLFIFISKNARQNHEKLELIHGSISKQLVKHDNQKQIDIKQENNKNNKRKTNVFNIISNESISTICSFIDKTTIQSFKLTSRRHGIICLQEMSKSMVGIIHCNQLNNICNLHHFDMQQMICNRYPSSLKYYQLYNEWFKEYNIPIQNQLLFDLNKVAAHSYQSYPLIDSVSMANHQIRNKQQYLLLDNRQIIILDCTIKPRRFNISADKYERIKDYKFIVLEYFDVFNQNTKVVQYILYDGTLNTLNLDLFNYIEHTFIPIGINNNEIQSQLSHLKQMSEEHTKLYVYKHRSIIKKRRRKLNSNNNRKEQGSMIVLDQNDIIKFDNFYSRLFTFQLNCKHPFFNNNYHYYKIKELALKSEQNMNKFYFKADGFCKDTIYVRIHFKGNVILLQSVIKHIYESKKENKIITNKNLKENILKDMKQKCMTIKISKTSKSHVLRHKISKELFNDIIDPKYIELLNINNFNPIKWNQTIGEIENVYYSVVLYDTQSCSNIN